MPQHTQILHHLCCRPLLACALLFLILIGTAQGQTAQFTYQGRLTDAGNPATGMYDFQFKLFDSTDFVTGIQQGPTLTRFAVEVTNGVFGVQLDFGAGVFDGSPRFLEISLRAAGSPNPFSVLGPRQPVTATPYAVRSATAGVADTATNASQLGGLTSSEFVQNTTTEQATTNFNIGGTGTASILNATTQFNLGGTRILSNAGSDNLFVGVLAGLNNTTGTSNSFFGRGAGRSNSTGGLNTFVGSSAGFNNTTGSKNTFIGNGAGPFSSGEQNTFLGYFAGLNNTTGNNNTFIGASAADSNLSGSFNTQIGFAAKVGSHNLNNATAIGALARVDQSNSLVLGSINGVNGATSDTNVGIGTTVPQARLHVSGGTTIFDRPDGAIKVLWRSGTLDSDYDLGIFNRGGSGGQPFAIADWNTSTKGIFLDTSNGNTEISGKLMMGGGPMISGSFAAQSFTFSPLKGIYTGNIVLDPNALNLILSSPVHLCIRSTSLGGGFGGEALARCTSPLSSTRYKTAMEPFSGGLDLINRLKPITFSWKEGGERDFGLNAEDVAEVEPLLVTRNAKGEVEDVKHENMLVVFINAFKQQQAQIKSLQQEIETLKRRQQELDALKALVCADRPDASICKSN